MNDKDLDHFRTLIIHNYLSVTAKSGVKKSSHGLMTNIDSSLHNLNKILKETGKGDDNSRPEEKLYFFNRKEEYIQHLIAAFERIEMNKYGLCVKCGKDIPPERLEEVPHTRYCVPCKNNTE